MHTDTNNNNRMSLTSEEFAAILRKIFNINPAVTISEDTDLAEYILDSIDLGELLAVLKQERGIVPEKPQLFSKYSKFKDVLAILNGTLAS